MQIKKINNFNILQEILAPKLIGKKITHQLIIWPLRGRIFRVLFVRRQFTYQRGVPARSWVHQSM